MHVPSGDRIADHRPARHHLLDHATERVAFELRPLLLTVDDLDAPPGLVVPELERAAVEATLLRDPAREVALKAVLLAKLVRHADEILLGVVSVPHHAAGWIDALDQLVEPAVAEAREIPEAI